MNQFTFIKRAFMENEFAPAFGNDHAEIYGPNVRENWYGMTYFPEANSGIAGDSANIENAKTEKSKIKDVLNSTLAGGGLYLGAKHVPGAVGSFFMDKPGSSLTAEKYKNLFDNQFLQRLPGIKALKTPGARNRAALGTALLAGGIAGLMSDNDSDTLAERINTQETSQQSPSLLDKAKNALTSDLAKTVGFTGGGGALGAAIGNLIKGEDGSIAWPLILGLLGSGAGYAYANKDNINWNNLNPFN